jgi:hypothetical protein
VDPIITPSAADGSRPPKISFGLDKVGPPSTLYVTPQDNLIVQLQPFSAGQIFFISTRLLLANGEIVTQSQRLAPTSAWTATNFSIAMGEGYLLSAVLACFGGTLQPGDCYARMLLNRGIFAVDSVGYSLAQGYVHTQKWLAFPGDRQLGPLEGPGMLRTIVGTNPAAGVEITETVPAFTRWRLISLHANLQTSAVVANRIVHVQLDDGANLFFQSDPNENQAASSLYGYNFTSGPLLNSALSQQVMLPLPLTPLLGPGYRIRTLTAALDGGDDWSAPVYLVEQWMQQ